MKTEEFLKILTEELELEDIVLTLDTDLSGLDEFDSLAIMTIIALVDENFNKKLTSDQLKRITTVKSMQQLIGIENFA
ncbi:MAG: acyl carrier protein [Salinivirgaceae bacterium]|jgi:acyl carrier protein